MHHLCRALTDTVSLRLFPACQTLVRFFALRRIKQHAMFPGRGAAPRPPGPAGPGPAPDSGPAGDGGTSWLPWCGAALGVGLVGRLDVLMDGEDVVGVIRALDLDQPVVVAAVAGSDPVLALVHQEVDVGAAGRGRVQLLPVVLGPSRD